MKDSVQILNSNATTLETQLLPV